MTYSVMPIAQGTASRGLPVSVTTRENKSIGVLPQDESDRPAGCPPSHLSSTCHKGNITRTPPARSKETIATIVTASITANGGDRHSARRVDDARPQRSRNRRSGRGSNIVADGGVDDGAAPPVWPLMFRRRLRCRAGSWEPVLDRAWGGGRRGSAPARGRRGRRRPARWRAAGPSRRCRRGTGRPGCLWVSHRYRVTS